MGVRRGDAQRPAFGHAPRATAIITRDERGQATVRATRLDHPLKIDGRLDEAAYSAVPSIDGFIQNLPREGQPSTERTEAWVFYD